VLLQTRNRKREEEEEEAGDYGSGMVAEAIVQHPIKTAFSSKHGKSGTWAVFKVNMERFDREGTVTVDKVADVPWARWLNGATFIPGSSYWSWQIHCSGN